MPGYPKLIHYGVRGSFSFPTDMLRYDQAFPATTEDAINIFKSIRADLKTMTGESFEIGLIGLQHPTRGRWASFGWKVIYEPST